MVDLDYESLRAGTTKENSDSGAEVARKFNDNFKKIAEMFYELDQKIQNNGAVKIAINGTVVETDEDGVVHLPLASRTQAGLVQSEDSENSIVADENGTMKVSSLNVNKLVQSDGETLILSGGNAST